MPEPQAVIINTGMMTSVGLTADETVASVSADIMQFLESAIVDRTFDPIKLALVPDDALPDLLELTNAPARHKRMLKLATMPLLECVEPVLGKTSVCHYVLRFRLWKRLHQSTGRNSLWICWCNLKSAFRLMEVVILQVAALEGCRALLWLLNR